MIMGEVKTDYDKHLEVANNIEATRDESWRNVEKMQYSIASGALALSITLLTFVEEVQCKWLIISSWVILVLSIVLNFVSHIVSYRVSNMAREEMFERMRSGVKYDVGAINESLNKHNKGIVSLNVASIVLLLLGVVGTLSFFIKQV